MAVFGKCVGVTRGTRLHRGARPRGARPLIVLYIEVSYTHPSGGMHSATVDNDNRTRDVDDYNDSDGTAAFYYFLRHTRTPDGEDDGEKEERR